MKIFEIFLDFSDFDCNEGFPYREHESEHLSRSGPNLTEFWRRYLLEKGRVQNCRGTPNFKVA
jgi:hypothetical protein